ncbi:hypothetical protein L6452_18125 [Arctium lappa]|uniref:Uncharacterized protein n=1 Tax=Arctium lappa TaxID=4217 RepID=A0ACB9C5H3_ARCLA|nr:hypothetical protein L6452_18125 [Arctium lappa]
MRKPVQPVEVSTEEAALSRSKQLRELYDSLETGEHQVTDNHQQPVIRRSSVALSPEDLTESEWFYLMCILQTTFGATRFIKLIISRRLIWMETMKRMQNRGVDK